MPKPIYPATVNTSSALGTGLVLDCLFHDPVGTTVRNNADASRNLSWVPGSSADIVRSGTGIETGSTGSLALSAVQSQALQLPVSGGYTIAVRYRIREGDGVGGSTDMLTISGSNGCENWGGLMYSGGSNNFYTVAAGCSGNSLPTGGFGVGEHELVGVMLPNGTKKFWFDGVLAATGEHTGNVQTNATNSLGIGVGQNRLMEAARLWNRALSDAEVQAMWADPYPAALYGVAGVNAAPPSLVTSSPASLKLVSAASGGTGPYTHIWSRSARINGVYSAIGGQTTDTLTNTPPTNKTYWFTHTATDSLGASFTTNPVAARLYDDEPIFVGWIADSLGNTVGANGTSPQVFCDRLRKMNGQRIVTLSNQSAGGTNSSQWLPGTALYNAAVAAFAAAVTAAGVSAGNKYVVYRHGANGVAAPDVLNTANALVALGYKVYVACPIFRQSGSETTRVQDAIAPLLALDNGDTIRVGSEAGFAVFAENQTAYLFDGVHKTDAGVEALATIDSAGFYQAFLDTAAAGTSGIAGLSAQDVADIADAVWSNVDSPTRTLTA